MVRASLLPAVHRSAAALGTAIVLYLYWIITKDSRPFTAYLAILSALLFIDLSNKIISGLAKKKKK